jgi:methyl-accepting chemotaxis protein
MTGPTAAHPSTGATPSLRPRLRKPVPRLGIVSRLTLIGVVSISVAVAVSIWTSVKIAEAEMYRRAQNELSINIKLLDSILAGYGAPSRKDDGLYFGSTLINGNFKPVDLVKAVGGGTATIFLGDQRVSTNVTKADGSRAVGTRLAAGPAYESVFGKHETYRGEADILGETYLTIYEPIRSGDKVLGIAYVGVKKAEFFSVLRSLVTMNLVSGAGVILLAGLVMLFLVRRIFAPIGTIRRELVEMAGATAQQELDARTLAALDVHLDELRQALYGRGEPRREGNTLFFGDRAVNNDLTLVDGIGTEDGTLVTVFMGDRRVTTNVRKADGSRVIGTTLAAGPVHDRVLKDGKTYRGDANIFDAPHFAIYEPILSQGEVIGILFVGTPRLAVTKQAAQFSAARRSDEIGEMQDAVVALGKAAKAKEIAEREAAEQRQEARDSQRRFQASQRDAQRRIDEERERTAQAQARIAEERAAEQAKMAEERERSAQAQARLTEERAAEQARIARERAAEQAKAAAEQTRVVATLAHGLAKLSDGDLTVRLHEGFTEASRQIRDDFNATAERLRETIGRIVAAIREVANASSEISGSTADLAQRTETQAASLEQTSAAMEEIFTTAKKNAENAQHASRSAGSTSAVAERSGQVVARTVEAMAKIEASSKKISEIIGVIDEIARQTNMLALNAAVEAARAGEAGRGFAVVASEVRSLAQRSSQAATDIKRLITNSNAQVLEGVELVNKAGQALGEIVLSIKDVAAIISEIASASVEQSSGIEQIKRALSQMDEITQQNSALVEQSAATAQMLETQAAAMSAQAGTFQIDAIEVRVARRTAIAA